MACWGVMDIGKCGAAPRFIMGSQCPDYSRRPAAMSPALRAQQREELRLVEDRHAELLRLRQLGAGLGAGDHATGPGRDAARDLGAQPLQALLDELPD